MICVVVFKSCTKSVKWQHCEVNPTHMWVTDRIALGQQTISCCFQRQLDAVQKPQTVARCVSLCGLCLCYVPQNFTRRTSLSRCVCLVTSCVSVSVSATVSMPVFSCARASVLPKQYAQSQQLSSSHFAFYPRANIWILMSDSEESPSLSRLGFKPGNRISSGFFVFLSLQLMLGQANIKSSIEGILYVLSKSLLLIPSLHAV